MVLDKLKVCSIGLILLSRANTAQAPLASWELAEPAMGRKAAP